MLTLKQSVLLTNRKRRETFWGNWLTINVFRNKSLRKIIIHLMLYITKNINNAGKILSNADITLFLATRFFFQFTNTFLCNVGLLFVRRQFHVWERSLFVCLFYVCFLTVPLCSCISSSQLMLHFTCSCLCVVLEKDSASVEALGQ